ncbi:MAG: CotS family spore coat protein [Clostridia bacterium]|nr:CotS family spore coat protein [Clostridia bacterium]
MSSASNEPLNEVLRKYDINVLGIRNESYKDKKGVWWVQTPEGYKILKKISNSEDTLKHILHAVKHLSRNDIRIPAVNKTRDGKDYVNISGTCYVLSDAVEGKTPSYDVPRELEAVVKELARFHEASKGFTLLAESKPKYHLGTWVEDYTQQVEDMNKFYKIEVAQKNSNAVGKVVIEEFPYFQERAQRAIDGLKGREYREWVDEAAREGSLCHQDFAAGNLLLAPAGKVFILDTDSITVDIPARDIRKLLNKIIKKHGKWDIELVKRVLGYYHAENPLTTSQWKVVMLDLMFPHLFIGAMNKYYYKRDKEWTNEKYLKRIKEMCALEKTITPVLDNFDSIIASIRKRS